VKKVISLNTRKVGHTKQ